MKVFDFPLTKITISFVIGILVSYYLQPSLFFAIVTLTVNLLIFIVLHFVCKKHQKLNILFGISALLISSCIGVTTLILQTDTSNKSNYTHFKNAFQEDHTLTLIIREKLKSNTHNDRYIGILKNIEGQSSSGKVIINITKDNKNAPLITGNIIKVKTTLQHTNQPKNPNQFDYSKYLANKQIFAQLYTNKSEIKVSTNLQKDLWYYASRINARIITNLEKSKFNKTEMNVALALILGQKQDLSPETVKNYQYSGAAHILSVSGLHVGFIMLFILFLLKPIPNTPKGSLTKLIILITSLGAFAILSGLSPPVLRSVIMFSFIAIADHLRRGRNIYHTLLVSAFIILLFQPYFLFEVGFQLSYIALFSILWLQPLLKNLWEPQNKVLHYIWEALTVSFAAQIGTFPICLYYFHQFPCLFFVTNIVILPFLSFIMIIGIAVMLIAAFTRCPEFLIIALEKLITVLNLITQHIASYESFIIREISFSFDYTIAFYLFLISTIIWLKKPTHNKLFITLGTVILLQLTFIRSKKRTSEQQELIVYNTNKNTNITEKYGRNTTLYTTDTLQKISSLQSYLTENFGILKATNRTRNTYFFNNIKILLIDSSCVYKKDIHPDILILTQSTHVNLDRVIADLKPKAIIADASNSYTLQKSWKLSCEKKKIPFHATAEKGYYKLTLESKF
ncbi:ComEC/Rec2 family competence protein [Flavobacterium hercynium]|uniref:Competence protein ComEC n=1 Tax=Flavobacterium hercynium TaxID=387094 RepID=A0A226HG84_9FLAO|nr:ComEC/Rec2 family competence protein [Flavobacterium hercynium]OXA92868.1 competence protein ComEC [Flavobacterium hercynium]SMP02969.1 competence protein ComEC [Flavobacterium hercynium]